MDSERNRLYHSGKPNSGFDETIPSYSDSISPEIRNSVSKEEWELVKDEVRDSRYRLAGLKDAIRAEAKKRGYPSPKGIDRKAIVDEKNALRRKSHDVDSGYSDADRSRSKELSRSLATGKKPQ